MNITVWLFFLNVRWTVEVALVINAAYFLTDYLLHHSSLSPVVIVGALFFSLLLPIVFKWRIGVALGGITAMLFGAMLAESAHASGMRIAELLRKGPVLTETHECQSLVGGEPLSLEQAFDTDVLLVELSQSKIHQCGLIDDGQCSEYEHHYSGGHDEVQFVSLRKIYREHLHILQTTSHALLQWIVSDLGFLRARQFP